MPQLPAIEFWEIRLGKNANLYSSAQRNPPKTLDEQSRDFFIGVFCSIAAFSYQDNASKTDN
jgi:hypothetical protein